MPYTNRKSPRADPTFEGLTGLQMCVTKHGVDPLDEAIKILKSRITVRNSKGEPLKDENGKIETRPLLDPEATFNGWMRVCEFTRPKLRTQEIKEQLDVKFTVTINRFEEKKELPAPRPAIDIDIATTQSIEAMTKAELL